MTPKEHHLSVPRTARYFSSGELCAGGEVWVVLHGYGQLAAYFIRNFQTLATPQRCIIAPEALSRFYLDGSGGRVGATWMTREDRLVEMDDYITYLDLLYSSLSPRPARLTLLGFSQGVSTALRWATRGAAAVDRLILWAGSLPPEIDLAGQRERINAMLPVYVAGNADPYITHRQLQQSEEHLRGLGIGCRFVRFEGGHALHAATLQQLAQPGV